MNVLFPIEVLGTFGLQSLMEEYFIWEIVFTISPSFMCYCKETTSHGKNVFPNLFLPWNQFSHSVY